MNRRKFLGSLAGGAVAAAVPDALLSTGAVAEPRPIIDPLWLAIDEYIHAIDEIPPYLTDPDAWFLEIPPSFRERAARLSAMLREDLALCRTYDAHRDPADKANRAVPPARGDLREYNRAGDA